MKFKIIFIIAVVIITLAIAGLAIFTSLAGGNAKGIPNNPKEIGFNTPFKLSINKYTKLPDGLEVKLLGINDSRCPKNAACIWEGEIVAQLSVLGGKISAIKDFGIGTVNNKSISAGGYTFTLVDADRKSATITVGVGNTIPGDSDSPADTTGNPSGPDGKATGLNNGATCYVGGCNSELCSDKKDGEGAVSTCLYKQEYACYQSAKCERQSNGNCGWTQTSQLKSCLAGDQSGQGWGLAQ